MAKKEAIASRPCFGSVVRIIYVFQYLDYMVRFLLFSYDAVFKVPEALGLRRTETMSKFPATLNLKVLDLKEC